MKTAYIVFALIIILIIGLIFKGTESIHQYYSQFPNTIVKLNSEVTNEQESKLKFPATLDIDYSLAYNSPMIHKGFYYAFSQNNRGYWNVTLLEKEKQGKVIKAGNDNYQNFVVDKPKKFGFVGYMEASKPDGRFKVTFQDQDSLDSFIKDFNDNSEWEDVYLYTKNHEGKSAK